MNSTSTFSGRFGNKAHSQREATLALWGAEGAGKTAFLAALFSAAQSEKLAISALDGQTEKIMTALRAGRAAHRFPPPTAMPTELEELTLLRFRLHSKKSHQELSLNLADTCGKWWGARDPERAIEVLLRKCDGILCLLDPTKALKRVHTPELLLGSRSETKSETLDEIELQTLLARLQRARQANREDTNREGAESKVAVCLTQMDRAEHYSHLGKEEAYFARLYGDLPFDNWIQAKNLSFFGCSAAGVLQRAGHTIANTYRERGGQELLVEPRVPPLHLFRPIKWLLNFA